ncbi:MAG: AAA family ATPase [Chloroflexota bacterium]|nr:AAA family ATPase [Chloroflexota bacterium]
MARLRLALLGSPQAHHGGEELRFQTRKALALLAYLAAEPGGHSREKLVSLFWPDADTEHGRTTLRTTLWFLRAALRPPAEEEHVLSRRDLLAFRFEAEHQLDLQQLADAAELAKTPHNVTPVHLLPRLQDAAQLYRGDFLEGFNLADAPDFDDWVAVQREAWHRRIGQVLDSLSRWQCDCGQVAEALESAGRWVALDPLNETAHRRMMELHLAAGDRAGALRAYDACRTLLGTQLGVEPESATEELAERARSLQGNRHLPASPEPPPEAPLVGRAEEFAALASAFRLVAAGSTRVSVIAGEGGIGKSRLASELVRWAAGQGADALWGQAFETAAGLPFQPVIEALRRRLGLEPDAPKRLPAYWLRQLARLLPELDEAAAVAVQPDDTKAPVFESVVRLLRLLPAARPLVILVDDLQWCDEASRDLLRYVVRDLAGSRFPALFLLCVRAEDLGSQPELERYLQGLQRDAPVQRLQLGLLGREATFQLLQSFEGVPLEQHGERLFQETGGHPLFLMETLRFWREHGFPAEGRRLLAPGVREAIWHRLALLGRDAGELAAAASVFGGHVSFEQLSAVAGLPETASLRALDELVRRRVLEASDGGYVFTHTNIRLVAYEEAGEARRRMLHRRTLEALELAGAPAGELIPHASALGRTQLVYALSVRAGDDALALSAGADAARHYQRALALEAQPRDEVRLLLSLGDAYRLCDQMRAAAAAFRRMLEAAEGCSSPRDVCLALNRLATVVAQEYSAAQDDPEALIRRALSVAESSGQRDLAAESLTSLSLVSMYRADVEAALGHALSALQVAGALARDDLEAQARTAGAQAALFLGLWEEGLLMSEQAASAYRQRGDRAREANALCLKSGIAVRAGELDAAAETARRALGISREIGNAWGAATACFHLAEVLVARGQCAQAVTLATEGVDAAERSGFAPLQACARYALGCAHAGLLQVDLATEAFEEAARIGERLPLKVFHEMACSGLCAVWSLAGDWGQALASARQALRLRSPASPFAVHARAADVPALAKASLLEEAEEDLAVLEALGSLCPAVQISVECGRAAIEAAHGSSEAAAMHLDAAADLAARHKLPGHLWQIRLAEAELHPERAAAALQQARSIVLSLDPPGELLHRFEALPRVRALSGER